MFTIKFHPRFHGHENEAELIHFFSPQVMSMLDPKTSQMFYFTGKNHTTPNCPLEMVADFNPSAGVPSYRSSDKACSRNAKYFIPFFLERPGPRYMQWSINAHEARPGHHTQVRTLCC